MTKSRRLADVCFFTLIDHCSTDIDHFREVIDHFHNFIGHSWVLIGHIHNFIGHFPKVIVISGPLSHLE